MTKPGRNDPCPCGSGKKYKKCCLASGVYERQMESPAAVARADVEPEAPEDQEFEDLAERPTIQDSARDCVATEEEENDAVAAPTDTPPPVVRYPKPREDLPELPADQEALIIAWWSEYKLLAKKRDADKILSHVVGFMEAHPALFVHLELEHEVLFELGAELGRRKEWPKYAALLERIRTEHPEMYVRSFSYYDCHLIIERLVARQFETIPRLFNFFHRYPDSEPDNAHRVLDLLAWTGRQDELFAFAAPLAIPMWVSPEVIGGGFVLRWLVLAQYVPLLDARTAPDEAARALLAAVERLGIPDAPDWDADIFRREFQLCRGTPDWQAYAGCRTDLEVSRFFHDVRWSFCGFLHDERHFPWVLADFLAGRIEDMWEDRPEGKKVRQPFVFDEARLDRCIARTCLDFFHINGVRAAPLIESVWHFADYLAFHKRMDEKECVAVHDTCRRLFDKVVSAVESTDPVPRLMVTFPEMACRRSGGVVLMAHRLKILFLCTGNSCRSQMAEGWARTLKGDVIEAYSAGIETHGLNPLAVKAMAEAGVDISRQRSKKVDELEAVDFDYVVTVCGHANETCPMWLKGKAKVTHVGFDDPPALAKGAKTEAEALAHYRRVRDEIRSFVESLPQCLADGPA